MNIIPIIDNIKDISGTVDKLPDISNLTKVIEPISQVCHYILNPRELLMMGINVSYSVCLVVTTTALIFYFIGEEKGIKIARNTFLGYVLLQSLKVVL